ncbi:endoglucanase z precursor (endo-1,4-beta-glucanase z) (cellulase z) (egz) [hydrocarbon metagenome]|uniref:Endoglucanase z (Endo-1,4-beta-glucanase z) (Cellulase z) (Egz) n=1 Tax=hydrocarbon metagenome TaxID=938273 RepID=A0A0W8FXT0_9ZZZZ
MKKNILLLLLISVIVLNGCDKSDENPVQPLPKEKTIVEHFGNLRVIDKNIVDQNGDIVVLRGMSLFWSQWGGQFYNGETIQWLRDDWKCTVVRAAMGVESGGYLENPEVEYQKVKTVIDACIELGIYVIVDWHDHHAEDHLEEAKLFFNRISSNYGNYPNIIYEIYNEPLNVSWNNILKPYSEEIIKTIRAYDQDNIIVVGTPNWSQDVEDIIGNKINDINIAYSFHFYSSTHKQELRGKAIQAINSGIPLFITEWGMSEATGNGIIDIQSLNEWVDFMEANDLSWCNWSVMNKNETSAALLSSTSSISGWSEDELSESGRKIRDYLVRMNRPIFDLIKN